MNLPTKLASRTKKCRGAVNVSLVQPLTDQEKGPLRYITGAVISKIYRKSKESKQNESTSKTMLQNFLLSKRILTELSEYLLNQDRGGLATFLLLLFR